MRVNRTSVVLLALLVVACATGCKKSPATGAAGPSAIPRQPSTMLRLHWLGMKQVAADTNAAGFMEIWKLPETAKLEARTLDKLALALAEALAEAGGRPKVEGRTTPPPSPLEVGSSKLAVGSSPARPPSSLSPLGVGSSKLDVGNSSFPPLSSLLRPLFDDLVQEESYLEVMDATNRPGDFVLAIRLPDDRAAFWQTNLAAALESLTHSALSPSSDARGWRLQLPSSAFSKLEVGSSKLDVRRSSAGHPSSLLALSRSGAWTVVSLARENGALVAGLVARIEQNGTPVPVKAPDQAFALVPGALRGSAANAAPPAPPKAWLEAGLDLRGLACALAINPDLPPGLPKAFVALFGDGKYVRALGQLDFPKPLWLDLEPWNFPTNFVGSDLVSFTAVRGFRPWLASLKAWQNLHIGPPPNQFFCWALWGQPALTYFSAPQPDAASQVSRLSALVLEKGKPWFEHHPAALIEKSETFNGLQWRGVPFFTPFLESIVTNHDNLILGGLLQAPMADPSLPPDWVPQLLSQTNLVACEKEFSALRIDQWIYISQFIRFVSSREQLPGQSAGMTWLKAAGPRLGNSATRVFWTAPDQLSFTRGSSVGFTAIELHLLIDWLESPDFPRGLHSFLPAPGEPVP